MSFLLIMALSLFLAVGSLQGQTATGAGWYDALQRLGPFKGLNTASTFKGAEYADVCNNISLSRLGLGSLSPLLSYDSASVRTNADSLISTYGYSIDDCTRSIVVQTDSVGVGYGQLLSSFPSSHDITPGFPDTIWNLWSAAARSKYSTINNRLVVSNGVQPALIWDLSKRTINAAELPITPPGAAYYCPAKRNSGSDDDLDGLYFYTVRVTLIDSFPSYKTRLYNNGYISGPVKVRNGHVIIDYQIGRLPVDSLGDSQFGSQTYNVVKVEFFRSLGTVGDLDYQDTLYHVDDLDTTIINVPIGGELRLKDSIADNTIRAGGNERLYFAGGEGLDSLRGRRNPGLSNDTLTSRLGALLFGDVDLATTDTASIFRGYNDALRDSLIAGVSYIMTFEDPRYGIESDSGPSLFVEVARTERSGSNKGFSSVGLRVPRVNSGRTYCHRNIYRALVYRVPARVKNTIINAKVIEKAKPDTFFYWGGSGEILEIQKNEYKGSTLSRWQRVTKSTVIDTLVVGSYRLVAQLQKFDSTIINDTVSMITADSARRFIGHPSNPLANVTQWNSRLFGSFGSTVFISTLDSASNWPTENIVPVNEGDGDFITGLTVTRSGLLIRKRQSTWLLLDDYETLLKIGDFGCIATHSIANGDGVTFYLSDRGVRMESEGDQLDNTYRPRIISEQLRNFEKVSDSILSNAVGVYLRKEQIYMLSIDYGSAETTFVFDPRVDGVTTYTGKTGAFALAGATFYNKPGSNPCAVPETMYFIRPGSNRLWVYGADTANLPLTYTSAPILFSAPASSEITGLMAVGSAAATTTLTVEALDPLGTVSSTAQSIDSLDQKVRMISMDCGEFPYQRLRMSSTGLPANTMIEFLDVLYRRVAQSLPVAR